MEAESETPVSTNPPPPLAPPQSDPPKSDPPKSAPRTLGKRKPCKNASGVWDHFTKIKCEDETSESRCICKYCKKDYACDGKRNGTSTLWHHLRSQCKNSPLRHEKRQKVLSFEGQAKGGNLVAHAFSKERCRIACVKMIIQDELPFSHVEGIGFREFLKEAQPRFELPTTIARDVWDLYQEEKAKIKSVLTPKGFAGSGFSVAAEVQRRSLSRMPMLTAASTIVSSPLSPAVGQCPRRVKLSSCGPKRVCGDGRMVLFKIKPVGLGAQLSLLERRKPVIGSCRSASVICASASNARCGAEQTQTVTREAPTITHLPGKEKSPLLDDGGSGFPPGDDGDGGGGGGGGGGNWSGGFAFFGFLLLLSFLKDKESEGAYRENRRR